MMNKIKQNHLLFWWLLTFAFLYFVFSPLVNVPFAHHDQWRYFFGKLNAHFFYAIFALARPFNSVFEHLVHMNVKEVADLSQVRLIFLVVLSMEVFLVSQVLQKSKVQRIDSLVISVLIFLLPGVQSFTYMGSMPFHGAFIFAYISYFFIQKVVDKKTQYQKRYAVLSVLFLLAALLTYQSIAFIFPFFLFVELVYLEEVSWTALKRIGLQLFPFFLGVGLYFLIAHGILYRFAPKRTVFSPNYLLTFDFNLKGFITAMLEGVIPKSLIFWLWEYSSIFAWMMGLLFIIFIVEKFKVNMNFGAKNNIVYFLLFIGLLTMSLGPYLLKANHTLVLRRVIFSFSAMLLLCNLKVLKNLIDKILKSKYGYRYALLSLLFIVAISVNKNITQSALGSNSEISFIYSLMNNEDTTKLRRVHYVVPINGYKGIKWMDDIFNHPSMTHHLSNMSLIHTYVCKRLAKETKEKSLRSLPYSYSMPDEPFEREEDVLVVDLTKLRFQKI